MQAQSISTAEAKPLNIIIAGGSIAGLMAGILLRRKGHRVTIFEQSTVSERTGLAAGIGMSKQMMDFFERHDRMKHMPLGTPMAGMVVMKADMSIVREIPLPSQMTTWDSIYYRLRANFDSFQSAHCLDPPSLDPGDGPGRFEPGKRVVDLRKAPDGRPVVVVENSKTGEQETHAADYLIGADGVQSTLRRILLPGTTRVEPGYCIWRGTVPTSELSSEARDKLDGRLINYQVPTSYAVIYPIPGPNGNLKDGQREINFAWYQYYYSAEELRDILTDTDGHSHRTTLPRGKMRPEIWQKSVDVARRDMHPTILELIEKVRAPFVSVVSSIAPQQASFMNDRVFLIGDSLFQLQPNSGQGSNMAAFGATTLVTALHSAAKATNEAERRRHFRDWEYKLLDRGGLERIRSILFANFFFRNRFATIFWSLRMKIFEWSTYGAKWWRWTLRRGGDGPDGYLGM